MSYSTAHEHVRVARALEGPPATRAAFSDGRLSYSKARAITRVATVDSEAELCELGLAATAVQIEAICVGYRQAQIGAGCSEQEQAAAVHRSRRVTSRDNHDGITTITIVLRTVEANACGNAIGTETDAIIADASSSETVSETMTSEAMTAREVIAERHGIAALEADAFVNLLTSPDPDSKPAPARVEVLVDIDQLRGADDDDTASADGSTCETGGIRTAASSWAATQPDDCTPITSSTGPTADRQNSPTLCSSATSTTICSTNTAGTSSPTRQAGITGSHPAVRPPP